MAERLGNSWHLCFWKQFKVSSLMLGWLLKSQTTAFSLPMSYHQMPKRINSCIPDPVYLWEITIQRQASWYLLQSILAFQLPPDATYCPAVTCKAQGGFTINWQEIKSRSFKGKNLCSEKAGECRGPTTIIISESTVKKSYRSQGPFPPPRSHPATLEVNSPQCVVSQLWVLWLQLSWCHSRKQWGSPTASEEETSDWDRSTLQISGEPGISRTQKTNFLLRRNMLSVWEKKRERTGEDPTCSRLAESPQSGKFLSF